MPACTAESLNKLLNNNNREYVRASLENSDTTSNSSNSVPSSPLSKSPKGTLRRSRSATPTSGDFQDHFIIKSEWRNSQIIQPQKETGSLLVKLIGWYPCFLLQVLQATIAIFLPAACVRTFLALPSLWVSAWIWIFWKIFDVPLFLLKWCLSFLYLPSLTLFRKKRTVLISGGSTIQSLHLARNFYSAGARVVVCEIDGLFSLARFSTAVSKFYTLPKPSADNQRSYIRALCEIIEKEGAIFYVPTNVTSSAIYDAAAKPVLELMGCTVFCPSVKDVLIFDDILEVFQRCVDNGIPTPPYYPISSTSKLALLYQNGNLRANKFIMSKCGPYGTKEKYKMFLPPNLNELKVPGEINEQNPWVIVENQSGDVFVTCTTVKQNQVVANITCQLDKDKSLKPVHRNDIELWLQNFFSKINSVKPISGHFTFRLVLTGGNVILPISCKVGVSLPYICYTSVHPKVLLKPCKHFTRQSSGPLTTNKGRYWMHRALLDAVQKPSVSSVTRLIGTVLDKREVLFVYWDPLPYLAYYHMQLPLRNISQLLHRRRLPTMATVPVQ